MTHKISLNGQSVALDEILQAFVLWGGGNEVEEVCCREMVKQSEQAHWHLHGRTAGKMQHTDSMELGVLTLSSAL